ncbi:tetratricopeptide repeat protein [Tenacibaculum maritimum]|uniref:ATP-binding protein n=1 Tax=Tenacibaculum maritimum TaxID=107401 RepID=UPI0012E4C8FE|nr:tetratricopeptide repeat-containing sensor histidine kinase [Tenacibaculum maritimum]CAA0185586.1 Two-component system sensor histidine kinase [Tenacibaculum maritimum]
MELKNILSLFLILFFTIKISAQKTDSVLKNNLESAIIEKVALKKYDEAAALSKAIIPLLKNKRDLGHYLYVIGYYFKKNNQIDSAYKYYQKSKNIYLSLQDSAKIAERLLNLAKIESDNELYFKSDSTAVLALKYEKGKKEKKNNHLASVYNCLGINANEQKEHKEAIKWYKLAIEATNDTPKKLRYMSNMAVNYKELKKYEHSIDLYRRIMRDAYYDSLPLYSKGKIIDNYAFVKFLGGKKVEKKEFLRAQEIKRKSKDNQGLIANYSHLSDYYKVKNRKKALRYAFEMYVLSKKIKAPKDRVEAIDKILGLAQGDNIKEYALERAYLSDSIQLAKKRSRNKFVKVIYNYEEEKKLRLAARADLAETKLLAEQQKKEKLILLFVGIFSVLGFIVYFFYKRAKTRKEKAEEVYKTETRLAKKIHDELASDVYHVMNKIQNRKVSNEELLDDLESIYYQTRDISHENSPIITGDSFENFLKQLFLDFTTNGCKILSKDLFKIEANTLSKEQQIVLYRLLRELLVNMKKHSKATLVVITFFKLKNSIKVQYKDNGIGAKEAVIKNGLQNMETRINSIGGSIIFETEEEKGFKSVFQFKK